MPDWPAWAREPVRIVAADDAWRARAAGLCRDLQHRLRPWLDGEVEHVGSTAVPGLAAKPIIDLAAPVTCLAAATGAGEVLSPAGWQAVPPELDARPWRHFHVLVVDDRRTAHLHLLERTHPRWAQMLTFRDALRSDAGLAADYAALKQRLARRHGDDRETYTAAKARFIEGSLRPRP